MDQQSDPDGTVADTLQFVIAQATRLVAAKRVWLFGSRARGLARRLSDIDIAIEIDPLCRGSWGELATSVHDDAPTLLSIDLVDIDFCGDELRTDILQTGRLVYERP